MDEDVPSEPSSPDPSPPSPRSASAGPARPKRRRRPKRKTTAKRSTAKGSAAPARPQRNFPASTFEDALALPVAIQQFAPGGRIRRLTLFEQLGKSPDSGSTRQLITNSSRYGLTKGSYAAEYLELTPHGNTATNQDAAPGERLRARFSLAIEGVAPFKALYEAYHGQKLPSQAVLRDQLREQGQPDESLSECAETFILNAKFLGLLRTIGGAERLLSIEHALDEAPAAVTFAVAPADDAVPHTPLGAPAVAMGSAAPASPDWSEVCFYVTPIGSDDSEQRLHSDLFLSALVEPALIEFGLTVVRADMIGKPGMITAQVIEHVVRSRIVIADLSFHNPNVFYEVALRHACRRPIVQLIRASEAIPFDLEQFRTIRIDTANIYTLVPRIETYRSEIASQVRRAIQEKAGLDNPLAVFYPDYWDHVEQDKAKL